MVNARQAAAARVARTDVVASPHVATSTPFGAQVDRVLDQAVASQRIVGAVVQIAPEGEAVYQRAAGSTR
jgi:hypothetical protein